MEHFWFGRGTAVCSPVRAALFRIATLLIVFGSLEIDCKAPFICGNSTTETILIANKHARVDITLSKSILFTWARVKSGNKMVITSTDNVNITTNRTTKFEINAVTEPKMTTPSGGIKQKASMFIWILSVIVFYKHGFLNRYTIFLLLSIYLSSTYISSLEDCAIPMVHVEIPTSYVSTLCINNECIETSCDLGMFLPDSKNKGYSIVDSSNTLLFKNNSCDIVKPTYWDEWVNHFFQKNDTSDGLLYFMDNDDDGLVNIIEYYGNVTDVTKHHRSRRSGNPFFVFGTSPKDPDSDGDLLLDGFESTNNLSPTVQDDATKDFDGDNLTNLDEQIHNTDPLDADSDGDGVNDGEEVKLRRDPTDPSDEGRNNTVTGEQFAIIRLVIGDHSGSHSERYTLNVGSISHQSPDFGKIGTGDYKFHPGTYTITIKWIATNRRSPDYDYTARVYAVTSNNVNVTVEDKENILGWFHDSSWDRTIGRSAKLIITGQCDNNEPGCFKDCETCEESTLRAWDTIREICKYRSLNPTSSSPTLQSSCPCTQCQAWYNEEIKDISWLVTLNEGFPCPCKWIDMETAREDERNQWEADPACKSHGTGDWGDCDYHPGAFGCLRSINSENSGQQCCYFNNQTWIPSGNPAAGTPDKVKSSLLTPLGHYNADVEPYKWCCEKCPRLCPLYIKGVRKGPDTCV